MMEEKGREENMMEWAFMISCLLSPEKKIKQTAIQKIYRAYEVTSSI
jgi:hypothetical protein